ncbi:MAG: hypothetical protein AAGD01_18055 [Acidobacteriota bacterium]
MPIEHADLISAEAVASRPEPGTSVPELFLENTKLRRHQASTLRQRLASWNEDPQRRRLAAQGGKAYRLRPRVQLPSTEDWGHPEPSEAVKSLTPAVLAGLLQHASRTSPESKELWVSASDLPDPLELYLAAANIPGLPRGIYHYHPLRQDLELLQEHSSATLATAIRKLFPGLPVGESLTRAATGDADISTAFDIDDLAALWLITGVPLRLTPLYGDRGYRSLLLAAGQTLGRLGEAAQHANIAFHVTHGLLDEAAHRLLGIDGVDELVLASAWSPTGRSVATSGAGASSKTGASSNASANSNAVNSSSASATEAATTSANTDSATAEPAKTQQDLPLTLGTDALVVPGEKALHVLNRRGSVEIQARGLGELHNRLAPHLDGRYSEAQLLAAVPPGLRSSVEDYLERLRETGALADVREQRDAAAESFVAPMLLSPRQIGERLLHLTGPERSLQPWTAMVSSPESDLDLPTQQAIARWVGVIAADPRAKNAIQIYHPEKRDELHRSAIAAAQEGPIPTLDTLPNQLSLVTDGDLPQLPLVVTTAAHAFFDQEPVVRYGLDFQETSDTTVRSFLAEALSKLEPAPDARDRSAGIDGSLWLRGNPADSISQWSVLGPAQQPRRDALATSARRYASSLPELQLQLMADSVVAHAQRNHEFQWRRTDLLTESPGHRRIHALQRILRLRRGRLQARIGTTPEGAFRIETRVGSRPLASQSFHWDQALRQVLLDAVWHTYYRDYAEDETFVAATPLTTFLTPRAIQTKARFHQRTLRRATSTRSAIFQRTRCWGLTQWMGTLEPEEEFDV